MAAEFERELARMRVDRANAIPVYMQIADALRGLIEEWPAAEGATLPPERVLCEQFGVSRMTLRQAFDVLQHQGLIQSERGRGTFVSPSHIQKQQQEFRSFTEEMAARGAKASSHLISFATCPPDPDAREFFNLSRRDEVYRIERLRLADEVPILLETVRIPVCLCPDLARFDLGRDSLYRILEHEYGIRLARSVEEITAVMAGSRVCRLLGLPRSVPLLEIRRRTFAAGDQPVELACSLIRGDRYRAVVQSRRAAAAP